MENTIPSIYNWSQFTPAFVLAGVACLILLADAFLPKLPRKGYALLGAITALVTGCFMYQYDKIDTCYGCFANLGFIACLATGLSLLLAFDYCKVTTESISGSDSDEGSGEFYALPLIACAGIVSLTQARDLVMLFVSLEVVTLSAYVMSGYFRRNQGSIEAGVKYLVLGAASTAILVFGAAWYFGSTGSFFLNRTVIEFALSVQVLAGDVTSSAFLMGMALLLIGAFFKVGAAPMHTWIPDVYQGSPTPASAFLATASKIAGFVVLLILLMPFNEFIRMPNPAETYPFKALALTLVNGLTIVTAATLLIGNLGAINQRNAKRLLGYSSIGQAGFILAFFVNLGEASLTREVNFYLLAYTIATVAAFSAIAMVRTQRGSEEISAFRGLGKTNPRTAFLITVSLASLAGVPMTMGFIAKFKAFKAVILAMSSWNNLSWLLPVMILCAAAGFYYYFKILRAMYWDKPQPGDKPLCVPGVTAAILTASALSLIALGTWPLLFNFS